MANKLSEILRKNIYFILTVYILKSKVTDIFGRKIMNDQSRY